MALGSGHASTLEISGLTGQSGAGTTFFAVRNVQLHTVSGESVDISHLGSGRFRSYAPPDLFAVSGMSCEMLFDTAGTGTIGGNIPFSDHATLPASGDLTGQATLTFRARSATTGASFSQTGWVESVDFGSLASNTEQVATVTVRWLTNPTFVAEA